MGFQKELNVSDWPVVEPTEHGLYYPFFGKVPEEWEGYSGIERTKSMSTNT